MEVNQLYKVSAQDARLQLSDMINRAVYSHQPSLVTRQGKPVAVLISFDQWQAYNQWQQRELSAQTPGPNPVLVSSVDSPAGDRPGVADAGVVTAVSEDEGEAAGKLE